MPTTDVLRTVGGAADGSWRGAVAKPMVFVVPESSDPAPTGIWLSCTTTIRYD